MLIGNWEGGRGGAVYGKLLPWDCHQESMIIFVSDLAAVHIIKISIVVRFQQCCLYNCMSSVIFW